MNWERAKNLCLIFLLILNIFLLTSINISCKKYKLNHENIKSISSWLNKNNIKFDKLLYDFYPKKRLAMRKIKINQKKISDFFYKLTKGKNTQIKFSDYGFECDLKVKQDNKIFNLILKKIKEPDANFILDTRKKDGKKEILEYRQKYCSFIIYNNIIRFDINKDHIEKIYYNYKEPANFFEPNYEIISPDKILFNFSKNPDILKNNSIKIKKFDLIYKNEKDLYVSWPYYRLIYYNEKKNLKQILFDACLKSTESTHGTY